MTILEIRGLTKHFDGIRAIEDVSFRVNEGAIVSIIGPNGAGKTTLFNCLTGLTKPTKGAIHLREADITGLPTYSIVRRGMARTFQNIRLFRDMSVLDNILVAQHMRMKTGLISAVIRGKGFYSEERDAREKALEYLAFVGLDGVTETPAASLPYGGQRRLEIARALATEPMILLLDEPSAGMNPHETSEIMQLIKNLQRLGKTVVIIEHDMRLVMGISEAIIVIDHGVKIAEGKPEAIRCNPLVIEAYLGKEAC